MKIVDVVKLDENGVDVEGANYGTPGETKYFDDNGILPNGNFDENNIAGNWLVIDCKVEINNNDITYAYRQIDNTTLVKIDNNWKIDKEYNTLLRKFDNEEIVLETNTPDLIEKEYSLDSIEVNINDDKIEEVAVGYLSGDNVIREAFINYSKLKKYDYSLACIAEKQLL